MPDLLCTSPSHPYGVFYRLRKLDETAAKSTMLCPWCDWRRLFEVRAPDEVRPDPYYDRDRWLALQRPPIGPHPNEQKKEEERKPGEMRNLEERIDDFETEAEMDRLAKEKEEPHA